MKIGILTSSRADFGIYYPLIKELLKDNAIDCEIIAFGTHLDPNHGHTIDEINSLNISVKHRINTSTSNCDSSQISFAIGDVVTKFSQFWNENNFDLVFALGDRYEMFAAVSAASPFNIDIAHIHAGETTLGAIDNAYRHSITHMSKYQFVSTDIYRNRVIELTENASNVYNVGGLSVDNLINQDLYTCDEIFERFNIDISKATILSTFHPETVALDKNRTYVEELLSSFDSLRGNYQIVVTLPNSDTMGDQIRARLMEYSKGKENIIVAESFGMKGYLSIMKYCQFMIGNTSSGFGEAAFFPTWVINIGDRQKGRIVTENIINIPVQKKDILSAVKVIENAQPLKDVNIYGDGFAAKKILKIVKKLYGLH